MRTGPVTPIRKQGTVADLDADPDVPTRLLGCGVPVLPSAGLVNAMRVGPDIAAVYGPPGGNASVPRAGLLGPGDDAPPARVLPDGTADLAGQSGRVRLAIAECAHAPAIAGRGMWRPWRAQLSLSVTGTTGGSPSTRLAG